MFCPKCGKEIIDHNAKYCMYCGAIVESFPMEKIESPWEDMENIGFFRAFIDTIGLVLFKPTLFFRSVNTSGGLRNSLMFGITAGSLGYIFSIVWQAIISNYITWEWPLNNMYKESDIVWASIFFSPAISTIMIFVEGFVIHFLLMLSGGNKKGWKSTIHVMCYSMSTRLISIIPFIGGLLASIWMFKTIVTGLRETHGISTGRIVVAVVLPFALISFLVIVGIIAIVMFMPNIFNEVGKSFISV